MFKLHHCVNKPLSLSVDCKFASLVVDEDFGQRLDCRQKDPQTFDLHLIRTPPPSNVK